ncbi:MAG: hypothetical protein U0169_01450 [Polyangiaceae bacterium]
MTLRRLFLLFAFGAATCGTGLLACSGSDTGEDDDDSGATTPDASRAETGSGVTDAAADRTSTDATAPRDASQDGTTTDVATDGAKDGASDVASDRVNTDSGDSGSADASSDAVSDTNVPDVSLPDASFDPVGSPCAQPNALQERLCGRCGVERRFCGPVDGGYVWQPWGTCLGERPTGCIPGSTVIEYCGLCGTRTLVCQNDCSLGAGGFCQRPTNAECEGDAGVDGGRVVSEFVSGLSCPMGEGRRRSCKTDCSWNDFGSCESPFSGDGGSNPNILVAGAAGQVVTGEFELPVNPKIKAVETTILGTPITCPLTNLTTRTTQFSYVQVQNPTAAPIHVSIWGTTATNGEELDTIMAVYGGPVPPPDTDESARKLCLAGTFTNDDCTSSSGVCEGGFAGLVADSDDGDQGVTIPGNGSITVYTALYFSGTVARTYALNVRVEP